MPVTRERLLQLALERLQNERQRIDSEISEINEQIKAGQQPAGQTAGQKKRSRRKMSPQEKKAASARMKKYWAERKKKEAAQKKA